MYLSEEPDKGKTCILAIHGGSWFAVKKDADKWDGGWMNYQAQYYAAMGYTTAAISYRSIDITEKTTVFDLLDDCKAAIKFIREKRKFGKLILIADSAGAHLAVELGLDDDVGVDIVIAANPVLDLTQKSWKHTAKAKEDYIKASPIYNLKKSNTKFLVIHGDSDEVVDYKISEKFCIEMIKNGTKCDFVLLKNAKHAFLLSRFQSTDEQVNDYMSMITEYIEKNLN